MAIKLVEGLDYSKESDALSLKLWSSGWKTAATKSLGGYPDVWRVDNHSLGKNCELSLAIHLLATRGRRIFIQIHNLPEDSSPSNYRRLLRQVGENNPASLAKRLYPQGGSSFTTPF